MKDPGLRYLGVALVVLVGIWAGLKFHSVHRAEEPGVAVPAGLASAPDPKENTAVEEAPHPVVPARLPDFSLNNLSGKSTSITSWRGKSLMINFWATWCDPCRREIPLLKTLAADWAGRDLTVVGIAVDHADKVRQFAEQFKIDYPVLIGEQDALDAAAKFGMDSPVLPFTVFTDRRGEVVALFVGELHRPQADFILSEVQNLNQAAHCPPGSAARHRGWPGSDGGKAGRISVLGRRSPPKLAFSLQFLVIIADLCSAIALGNCLKMSRILLLNGPNLNLLGTREPAIYGTATLQDIEAKLKTQCQALGHELIAAQSNAEHELIARVHAAKRDGIGFVIINPGAFTHTSIALRDAFLSVGVPFIEIHLSNVFAREAFRHHSYLSDVAVGCIYGLGPIGYELALQAAVARLT